MDITSINALERALAAKFERRTRLFSVGIDFAGSETVTIEAETASEAELKAKILAREMFEKDCLVKAKE